MKHGKSEAVFEGDEDAQRKKLTVLPELIELQSYKSETLSPEDATGCYQIEFIDQHRL